MQKIQSLFKRDYEGTRLIYNEIVEGSEWVVAGEGIATEKFDGTSCLISEYGQKLQLLKRYDAKQGKNPPDGFIAAQEPDEITGHYPGWIPVDLSKPENKWHTEAFSRNIILTVGTYELVGAKIQGNPYNLSGHELWKHGSKVLENVPTDFAGLKQYLTDTPIEGIVWHHPDGRMVKIKSRDFGLVWNSK